METIKEKVRKYKFDENYTEQEKQLDRDFLKSISDKFGMVYKEAEDGISIEIIKDSLYAWLEM